VTPTADLANITDVAVSSAQVIDTDPWWLSVVIPTNADPFKCSPNIYGFNRTGKVPTVGDFYLALDPNGYEIMKLIDLQGGTYTFSRHDPTDPIAGNSWF